MTIFGCLGILAYKCDFSENSNLDLSNESLANTEDRDFVEETQNVFAEK